MCPAEPLNKCSHAHTHACTRAHTPACARSFPRARTRARAHARTHAQEINDVLQENGQLQLNNMGTRFNLPTSFVTESIVAHLGTIVRGRVEGPTLYTQVTRPPARSPQPRR